MPAVNQTLRLWYTAGMGSYDQATTGWANPANIVYGGEDFEYTFDTCFPSIVSLTIPGCTLPVSSSSGYRDCNYLYAVETQVTAAADSSRDLASWANSVFTVGVLTSVWLAARSPDGDTIYAQWYKDGVAVGSSTSFDSEFHTMFRLPDFQYELGDLIAGTSLTLRLWGGTCNYTTAMFVPRVTEIVQAEDIVDPSSTNATVVSDAISPSGGDVVQITGAVSGYELFLRMEDPLPITGEISYVFGTFRASAATADTDFYGDFRTSTNPPGFVGGSAEGYVFKNGVLDGWGTGVRLPWFAPGSGNSFTSYWLRSQANSRSTAARHDEVDTWLTNATITLFDPGDYATLEILGDSAQVDQVIWARRIEVMSRSSNPSSSTFDRGDTFNLDWQYRGPDTWGGSDVDVSGRFTSVDGVVYDSSGSIIYTETGVGDPWTVDTALFPAGTDLVAVVRGNLDDGSYAYTGWEFDSIGNFVPQIYRRY